MFYIKKKKPRSKDQHKTHVKISVAFYNKQKKTWLNLK